MIQFTSKYNYILFIYMKITISQKNKKNNLPNQIIKELVKNPNQQLFWQEPSCFQNITDVPVKKCQCYKQGQNNNFCFQETTWLKYTYIAPTIHKIIPQYQKLPYAKILQIDYVYELIEMHIYKKFNHLLIGQEEKQKLINILFKFANSNFKIKRIPYLQAYGWLACHILLHTTESKTYYILDEIIERMKIYDIQVLKSEEINVLKRLKMIIPQSLDLFRKYSIDPIQIIHYFSSDIFSRSINKELMGWNIQKYFQIGWQHFTQLMCSYIDYKLQTSQSQTRNQLYKNFFSTGNVEWPLIFSNLILFREKTLIQDNIKRNKID